MARNIPPFPVTQVTDLRHPAIRDWLDLIQTQGDDSIGDNDFSGAGIMTKQATDTYGIIEITVETGLGITNGSGVSGDPEISLDFNAMTEDTTPNSSADYLASYDASAGSHKKVTLENVESKSAIQRSWMGI